MSRKLEVIAFAIVAVLVSTALRAENWPQFRGNGGTGVSGEKSLPTQWSDTRNLKWKTALPGPGSSSPIVWGDKVFVTCYSGYGAQRGDENSGQLKRHLLCVSRKDGKILWSQAVESAAQEDRFTGYITEHGYASHTPATDGQHVYCFYGKSGVVAFDYDGKKVWQTSVGVMSGNRRWGSAASPILYKNLVIVNAADEDRAIYGLDKTTGKVVWKAPGDRLELTYGTPVLAPLDGEKFELILAVPGEIWGLSPDTGKLVWYAQSPVDGNVSPSVVVDKENVYAFGGFPRLAAVGMRRGGKNDVTKSHVLWSGSIAPYVATPVLTGGHLYWIDEKGIAYCMEARTGKVVHKQALQINGRGKLCYAGTILAGGNLYSITRTGGTVVWSAGPEFKEISRNTFASDTSDFNASPAMSDGAIFIRSNTFLYCVEAAK